MTNVDADVATHLPRDRRAVAHLMNNSCFAISRAVHSVWRKRAPTEGTTHGRERMDQRTEWTHDDNAAVLTLAGSLPYRLLALSSTISHALSDIVAPFDLGLPEFLMMATLAERGEATAKVVGSHAQMHKTKVSRAASTLLSRNLIARRSNPTDHRQAFLQLTTLGRDVYEKCAGRAAVLDNLMRSTIGAEDGVIFARSIAKLCRQAQHHLNDKKK